MSQKELGYIELQWTCPNCSHVNPGTVRSCEQCGAPQPDKVVFEQGTGSELRKDEAIKKAAQAGPDIHCPYCGTRNPGDAKICSQCGGDISEGARRAAGQVLGAYQTGSAAPIACPRCGTMNPAQNRNCQNCGASFVNETPAVTAQVPPVKKAFPVWLIVLIVVVCLGFAILFYMLFRTDTVTGTIQQANWQRSIPIEALVPVVYTTWQDQIPEGAEIGACREELREEVSTPVQDAVEVCGTPYTVDTGSGVGKVVQDCLYQVYDQYCSYTVQEWRVVDTVSTSGVHGQDPSWPEFSLAAGQREGSSRQEAYTIVFLSDGKIYNYQTGSYELFRQAEPGDVWSLEINGLGQVISAQP